MGSATRRGRAPERPGSSRAAPTRAGPSSTGPSSAGVEPLASTGTLAVGPGLSHANLLQLQRTAGNRAVRMVIQRAAGPLDDTVPGVAVADTMPQPAAAAESGAAEGAGAEPPVPAGASTAAGSLPPVSARPGGAGSVSQPAGPGGVLPVGGGGPVALGGPVEPGFAGAVDQTRRRLPSGNAVPMPDHAVEATFDRDPSRVFRSPSDEWHYQLWNLQKGKGFTDEPPPAFRAGDLIAVAPDYAGRATALPSHSGDDRTGLGTPPTPAATALDTTPPSAERPLIRAAFPGSAPGPQTAGRPIAEPATHAEVVAVLAANPRSVMRSPNDAWHAQGYSLDLGKGPVPTAYKVEGVVVLAPGYPEEGLPAAPAGPAPGGSAGPAPAATPGPATSGPATVASGIATGPATGAAPSTGAAAPADAAGDRRIRGDLNVTKGAPGVAGGVMVEDETVEGDATRKTARGGTGSLGGGNVGSIGAEKVTTVTTGDTAAAVKTAANATLKPDGTLALGGERTRETFEGTDAAGQPIKKGGTSKFGGVDFSGDKGAGATAGASQTNAAGDKHTGSAAVRIDPKGNVSGTLAYSYQSKGGTSFTPSVSGGVEVQASDPVSAAGGGFDVTYTVATTKGAAVGVGKQMSGGPTLGGHMGTTDASLETGTMHFDDEKKANAFKDHAATVIVQERFLHRPPTTVEGALQIPIGEERGSGNVEGSNAGVSVAYEGASLGYDRSSSTTHKFSVRRIGEKTVLVTGMVSGTKGSDVSIGGGLADVKGSSTTKGFAVTWEFDLGTPAGRSAFERYATSGLPPITGATLKSMTSSGSEEDHDNVSIPLLGTAKWTGTTWEVVRTDDKGTAEQFGGQKAHDQDPSWFGRHVMGQDELHSSAQIVSSVENAKDGHTEEGYQAQVKVSGESGDYNREELGRMFMGVPHEGDAKPSGEWTLSAEVSPAVVRELERNNREMREAATKADKLRVYSKLVKERGSAMVGAQVGLGGEATAWNLELKGDRNFPGEAGRAELDRKRAALKERLTRDPANARSVASETQQALDELAARRAAVADHKRYTDLPDGLRDEQLKVIDKHISDLELIRHRAAQEAIKAAPGEKIEAVRGRLAEKHGYKNAENSAEGVEMARLRDRIADKEASIKELDPGILEGISAVGQAQGRTLNMPPGFGGFAREHRASYNQHWNAGVDINERQMAMAPKADALRMKLLEYLSPAERKSTAEALLAQLSERLTLLNVLHGEVVSAAEALKPITTARGLARHEQFWAGIKSDATPVAGGEPD
jgi:hypothetical protein